MLIYFDKNRILNGLLELKLHFEERNAVKSLLRGEDNLYIPKKRYFTFKQSISTIYNISKRKRLLSTLITYIILNRKDCAVQKANQVFNYFFELEYDKINRPQVKFGRAIPDLSRNHALQEYQNKRFNELQLEDFDDFDLLSSKL